MVIRALIASTDKYLLLYHWVNINISIFPLQIIMRKNRQRQKKNKKTYVLPLFTRCEVEINRQIFSIAVLQI